MNQPFETGAGRSDPKLSESTRAEQERGGLRRRELLKAGGVLGAATFLEGCRGRERQQIEQVLDRSRTPPGSARWVRSICGQCPGGCEVTARVIDGRAKKIEGDPTSRLSMGGVCALGHSALQGQYLPERPIRPLRRNGGDPVESSWEEALEAIAPRLATGESLAFCCGPDPLERAVVEIVAGRLGASVTVVESPVRAVEATATEKWLGAPADVDFSFDAADLLITLGASPLDRWGNPVAFARRLAEARARGLRWVHVAERMSLSAAKADLWIAPRPGTARHVAALLDRLVEETSSDNTFQPSSGFGVALDRVTAASDVPRRRLQRLVSWWRQASASALVVGGEDLGTLPFDDQPDQDGQHNIAEMVDRFRLAHRVDALERARSGTGTMRATSVVEVLRRAFGGGLPDDDEAVRTRSLDELADACRGGEIETVIAIGVDPMAATPRDWGLQDVASEGVVSIAHRMDETARLAGWVLPAQTDLEQTQVKCSPATGQILVADGVLDPRGDARHPLDILRALALAAGIGESALPFEDAEDLREDVLEAVGDLGGSTVARALRGALRDNGRLALKAPDSWRVALPEPAPSTGGQNEEADGVPSAGESLALQIFEAPRGETGAFDRPWIAELPDPVSTVMWGSWIELSPVDAERLGLSQGAAVEVISSLDPTIVVPSTTYIHPACRPGTAAMPMGVFRRGDGRSSALDLMPRSHMGGAPFLRAFVDVRPAATTPAPIFGRGLRSAEQIPAGWKAHDHAALDQPAGPAARQVVSLGRSSRRSEGEPA